MWRSPSNWIRLACSRFSERIENGREWTTAWSGTVRCGWAASLVDLGPLYMIQKGLYRVPTGKQTIKRLSTITWVVNDGGHEAQQIAADAVFRTSSRPTQKNTTTHYYSCHSLPELIAFPDETPEFNYKSYQTGTVST